MTRLLTSELACLLPERLTITEQAARHLEESAAVHLRLSTEHYPRVNDRMRRSVHIELASRKVELAKRLRAGEQR